MISSGGVTRIIDSNNQEVYYPEPAIGRFVLPINVYQGNTTPVNGSCVWMMYNSGSSDVYVRHLHLISLYAGATVSGQVVKYMLCKFSGSEILGGNTSFIPVPKIGNSGSSVTCKQDTAGQALSTGSVSFGNDFLVVGIAAANAAGNYMSHRYDLADERDPGLKLLPGEGMTIRLGNQSVVGQGISGMIEFGEG